MPSQHKQKNEILIGCDPEVFFKDKKTGKFISAHTMIPGTKLEPFKVPGGALQVDGVAAEFNIDPAASQTEWLVRNAAVIQEIKNRAPNIDLVYNPTVEFEKEYFESLPVEVRELGCNPDFNAWTNQLNPSPDGSTTCMRSGGGHIHYGWRKGGNPLTDSHRQDCTIVIRNSDYCLGMMSLMYDHDDKRRTLYGRAGSMRFKPYGVEYRSLSNKWLATADLQAWVYNTAWRCMDFIFEGGDLEEEFKNAAQIIIDNNIKWWDVKELKKHTDKLPEGIDLRKLSQFYVRVGLKVPPIPQEPSKTKTRKDPMYKYGKSSVEKLTKALGLIPTENTEN